MKKNFRVLFVFLFVNLCLLSVYSQDARVDIKKLESIDSFNLNLKSAVSTDRQDYFDGQTSIIIKNTGIQIKPPKAFRLDDKQDNLLVQDWTGSNILVQELQVPYKKMILGVSKESFLKQGFDFVSSFDVFTKSGNEGKLYILSFKTGEWEYERLVLLSGNDKKTAWISANYPVIMRHLLYEILENSILNIEF
jgi:hypothetical protein